MVRELQVGDAVPDVQVFVLGEMGPEAVSMGDLVGRGTSVIFGVPGAFTPSCSTTHLPGYVAQAHELAQRGVDRVLCIAVNDAWVLDAWARAQGVDGEVGMIADGNADFARALGLDSDLSKRGMGVRSRRYSLVVVDGLMTHAAVEPGRGVEVTSCEVVLQNL